MSRKKRFGRGPAVITSNKSGSAPPPPRPSTPGISQQNPSTPGIDQAVDPNIDVADIPGEQDGSLVPGVPAPDSGRYFDPRDIPPELQCNPVIQGLYPELNPQPQSSQTPFNFERLPQQLYQLPRGDAGGGDTLFRRTQIFARLDDPNNSRLVPGNPFNLAVPIGTQRSSDARPRYWHCSFYGVGIRRFLTAPASPLDQGEIIAQSFRGNSGVALAGSTAAYVPTITTMMARVMIHDESGGRYVDVDIIGTRSLSFYGFSATVFIMIPGTTGSYEVSQSTPANNTQLTGLVEDAMVGARVVPYAFPRNNFDPNITTVSVCHDGTAEESCIVPIPPGSRTVQVLNIGTEANQQNYTLRFDTGPDGVDTATAFAGITFSMGPIVINGTTFLSEIIRIPQPSNQIIITSGAGDVDATQFDFMFNVTA